MLNTNIIKNIDNCGEVNIIGSYSKINKENKVIYLNSSIFKEIPGNIYFHKKEFLKKQNIIKKKLINLKKRLNKKDKFYNIYRKEINYKLRKINFLISFYDYEANKLNKSYKVKNKNIHFYNKELFGFTYNDISYNEEEKKEINNALKTKIKKDELLNIIKEVNEIFPNIKFNFGNYINLSHYNGLIKIPDKEEYTYKQIITIFFHEFSHFLRHQNSIRNYGHGHYFSGYETLEEGFALYNEYKYGNLLLNDKYGEYFPINNKLYEILLLNAKNKKELFIKFLVDRNFSEESARDRYIRFYRYSRIGSKELFLKELIYNDSYKRVRNLLKEDFSNYEKINSGKIGIDFLVNFEKLGNLSNNLNLENVFFIVKKYII